LLRAAAKVHTVAMFEWGDLRYFLAVARHGSTLAASRALGTSQSTVQRRLAALERALGRKLVERQASGYRLTEFGRQMLPHAERIEQAFLGFAQHKNTIERGEVGVVRLTCPEPIMTRLIAFKFLDRFHARHPKFRVEFVMSDKYLDVSKGEADVALRSGDTDDAVLVGRKVADSLWAVYASRSYIERHGQPASVDDLKQHLLLGFDETMSGHRASTWLAEIAPQAKLAARVSSVLGLVAAAKSGLGVAPLPTALGDAEPELVQVLGPVRALQRSWRLLTHPDLRATPRVSAFFDFVRDELPTLRPILTG
jgi:DNA-binding transcriptional LysR family regulator